MSKKTSLKKYIGEQVRFIPKKSNKNEVSGRSRKIQITENPIKPVETQKRLKNKSQKQK